MQIPRNQWRSGWATLTIVDVEEFGSDAASKQRDRVIRGNGRARFLRSPSRASWPNLESLDNGCGSGWLFTQLEFFLCDENLIRGCVTQN